MEGSSQTPFSTDVTAGEALSVKRFFTTAGQHAFDTVDWETRDARIAPRRPRRLRAARRRVPDDVVAERDEHRRPEVLPRPARLGRRREHSVKQMIGRVAGTIADWGRSRGYFASVEDGDTFEAELTYILVHQMAAFNSPVWFNVGLRGEPAVLGVPAVRRAHLDA